MFTSDNYVGEGYQNVPIGELENYTLVSVEKGETVEITQALKKGGKIEGRRLDAETGELISSGMKITVLDQTTGERVGASTSSSTSGDFTISGLPDGSYYLYFEQNGYSIPYETTYANGYYTQPNSSLPQVVTIADGKTVEIDVLFTPGATIAGYVLGEDFYNPTYGLYGTVYLYDSNGQEVDRTSADYQYGYVFIGVAPGEYYLRFGDASFYGGFWFGCPQPPDYYSSYYDQADNFADATPIVVAGGDILTGIDGVLPVNGPGALPPNTAVYTITGRVTTAAGTPIPNTLITADTGQKTSTNTNGEYTLKLVSGDYQLTADKPGYTFDPDPLTMTVDGDETGQDFTAVPSPTSGTVNGTVTDDDTTDPLDGIVISVYEQVDNRWTFVAEAMTNASGRYTATLHTADFRLHFRDPQNGYQPEYYDDTDEFTAAQLVTVADGQTVTADAELAAKQPPKIDVGGVHTITDPDSGEVTIRVTNGRDDAIAISYEPVCATGSPTDVTLVAGSALFPMSDVGNGRFTVTLDIPDDVSRSASLTVEFLCDGASQTDSVGQIQLYDPSGVITDISTGGIITDARVTLYRVPNALPDTDSETNQCRTVDTRPTAVGGAFGAWSGLPAADLAEGVPVNAEIDQINGFPLFDPAVTTQQTDADGRYGWDVAEGCWFVMVEADGYETAVSPLVGVPPAVLDLDIALTPESVEPPPPANPTIYLPLIMR